MRLQVLGKFSMLFLLATVLGTAHAQTLPPSGALDQTGLLPYQSYHGGDIDSVGLSNGTLSLHASFLSYPQQDNVKLSFDLYYNNMPQHVAEECSGSPTDPTCYWLWGYQPGGSGLPVERGDPFVGWAQQTAVSDTNVKFTLGSGSGAYTVWYGNWAIQTADGSSHILGNLGTQTQQGSGPGSIDTFLYSGPWESLDATAWRYSSSLQSSTAPYGGDNPTTGLIGPDGIKYGGASQTDTNGNTITLSSGIFTDTLGRHIPAPPTSESTSNTSTSACPQMLLPVSFAVLWSPPEPSGTSGGYTFCYIKVAVNIPPANGWQPDAYTATLLQSIVLPNGQTWNFAFDDPGDGSTYNGSPVNYGTLTHVTLPTGGTLSYTYTNVLSTTQCQNSGRWVTSRTVNSNDGTGGHEWTYAYTYNTSTTVTDPLGNYAKHTFGYGNNSCTLYETENQQYQSGGTLLKTVQTIYSGSAGGNSNDLTNVVPTQIETSWPNNQTSETKFGYDTGFSYLNYVGTASATGIYGKVLTKSDYDYGTSAGIPGAILRTTNTQYEAFINSAYKTSNLLDLPSSVQLNNAAGTQIGYTTYGYDSPTTGNLTSVNKWLNTNNTYLTNSSTYCTSGLVATSTDPNMNKTTFTYTPACEGASPTSITNPLGKITYHTYDANTGLLLSTKDPNSQTTTFTYDNMWRISTVTYPDLGQDTITRQETTFPNTATLTKKMEASQNFITTNVFDGLGRVTQSQLVSDPVAIDYTDTTYDADGRKYTVSNSYRSTGDPTYGLTTYSYDGLSRVTLVTPPTVSGFQNRTIQTSYSGSVTTVLDNVTRIMQADALGRLDSVCEVTSSPLTFGVSTALTTCDTYYDSQGYITSYGYDALGDLLSVSQSGLNPRTFAYDSLSRLTSSTNPESGTVSYSYDKNGNLISRIAPKPNQTSPSVTVTTTSTYDALNRITTKSYNDRVTPTANFVYDTCPSSGCPSGYSSQPNSVGRLVESYVSNAGTFESYDAMGRVAGEWQCTPQNCGSTYFPFAYTYDLFGNMLSSRNGAEGPVTLTYSYNSAAQLSQLTSTLSDSNHPGTLFSNATYNAPGLLTAGQLGNGIGIARAYDPRLRLTSITDGTVYSLALTYDTAPYARLASSNDSANGDWGYDTKTNVGGPYGGYDVFNRLVVAVSGSNSYSYAYDRYGNRWQQLLNNACTAGTTSCFTFDANNHINSGAATYDAAGNVTSDNMHTYTYDAENRLVSVDAGTTAAYIYDANGRRIRKTTAGTSVDYLYDLAGNQVSQMGSTGGWNRGEVYAAGRHLATYTNGTTYFVHADWLGTERARSNVIGALYETCTSLPFGDNLQCSTSDVSPLHFTGKQHDSESGLDYFGARYDSSGFGRFTSSDWSANVEPVPYAKLDNPQSLNLYSFVLNNPLNHTDVDGHCDSGPGCVMQIVEAVNRFADNTGGFIKSFVMGAAKQEASTMRESVGMKPDPSLNPSNDVERAGASALTDTEAVAAVVLPLAGGMEGEEPGGSFMGPKEGSSNGPGSGETFDQATKQAAVDENATANGGPARCVFCGERVTNDPGPNKVNVDHARPRAKRGNSTLDNAQVACQYCNQSKGTSPAPKNPKQKPPSN